MMCAPCDMYCAVKCVVCVLCIVCREVCCVLLYMSYGIFSSLLSTV